MGVRVPRMMGTSKNTKKEMAETISFLYFYEAGDGNRTHAISLEG